MNLLPWVFLIPVLGLLLTAAGVGRGRTIGIASLPGPLLVGLAGLVWALGGRQPVEVKVADWLPLLPDGTWHLRLDGLAAAMLMVVGFVSFCIYAYSLAYMDDLDEQMHRVAPHPGKRRFFCYLDFFVASMALLVLAGTVAVLLVGWAGVGLASFLLISFYREKPGTLGAGVQALAANAVGDAALLLAAVLVPRGCGDLTTLQTPQCTGLVGATALASLMLIAAAAKSAQGPLYFWLPSAMAGPTPVSALIHAATMVAAGVYLLVRTHALLEAAPSVLAATAWLGVLTAVPAAVASLAQENFKRGIAYSTLSQLGYMFAGVGFGAPFAALFHLVTHAAFKALLFLTSGVVIHAMGGEERLVRLHGMQHVKELQPARWLFLVGSLALIGVPVITAGAFSKDGILEAGLHNGPPLNLLAVLLVGTVFLTGLYAGRLYWIVFGGQPNQQQPHKPDGLLIWPLVPLALGALLLGYAEWPRRGLSSLVGPAAGHAEPVQLISPLGIVAGLLGLAGFGAAYLWQQRQGVGARLAVPVLNWVDSTARLSRSMAGQVAGLHSGRLGAYVLTSIVGVAAILLVARALAP
jgi:NADH-quinone oxidoreductase subunit L